MKRTLLFLGILFCIFLPIGTFAENNNPPNFNWISGEKEVQLNQFISLHLDADKTYINSQDSIALNNFIGNSTNKFILGSIFPLNSNENWQSIIEYHQTGFVSTENTKVDSSNLSAFIQNYNLWNNQNKSTNFTNIKWAEKPYFIQNKNILLQSISFVNNTESLVNTQAFILTKNGYIFISTVYPSNQSSIVQNKVINLLTKIKIDDSEKYQKNEKVASKINLNTLSLNGLAKHSAFIFFITSHLYWFVIGIILITIIVINVLNNKKKER